MDLLYCHIFIIKIYCLFLGKYWNQMIGIEFIGINLWGSLEVWVMLVGKSILDWLNWQQTKFKIVIWIPLVSPQIIISYKLIFKKHSSKLTISNRSNHYHLLNKPNHYQQLHHITVIRKSTKQQYKILIINSLLLRKY